MILKFNADYRTNKNIFKIVYERISQFCDIEFVAI